MPDHSQLRLPAPGNNAQAVSKTGEAARERTVHVRVCTCNMCPGRARSGKADRKLRALHAWLLAGPVVTPAGGGLVSLARRGW